MKTMLLILMALFASCALLTAQDAKQADAGSAPASDQHDQQQPSQKPDQKLGQKSGQKPAEMPDLQDAASPAGRDAASSGSPLLRGAEPAGVEEAARKAAHDLAATGEAGSEPKQGDRAGKTGTPKTDRASSVAGVGEFHTLPAGADRTSAKPVVEKGQSPAKRIHGDVYGAGSGVGRATSEAVGATSKSGKTSVYVGSGQTTSALAPPQ